MNFTNHNFECRNIWHAIIFNNKKAVLELIEPAVLVREPMWVYRTVQLHWRLLHCFVTTNLSLPTAYLRITYMLFGLYLVALQARLSVDKHKRMIVKVDLPFALSISYQLLSRYETSVRLNNREPVFFRVGVVWVVCLRRGST